MKSGDNLFLVGMMGSWKTTVGRQLAQRLGLKFVDLDREIEAEAGQVLTQIFKTYGESYFRRLEKDRLKWISGGGDQVVATGGGIVMDAGNRDLLRERGRTVFLYAPPAVLARRIGIPQGRPLLEEGEDLEEGLERIWQERKTFYHAVGQVQIDTRDLNPGEVVDRVCTYLEAGDADYQD